ncbi:MAG: phosphatidylinositol-specific phospholipase C/glycerophosphodiester phosphodiesterase family protein [Pirellulales bacterium]
MTSPDSFPEDTLRRGPLLLLATAILHFVLVQASANSQETLRDNSTGPAQSPAAEKPASDDRLQGVVPRPRAHSHNDYEHQRPLWDALAQGFCSVEADIHLVGDQLLVGHDPGDVRPERTLAKLYLEPLRERLMQQGGQVWPGITPFVLMIDIKTDGTATYRRLAEELQPYASILTRVERGEVQPGPLLVVISGNRDWESIAASEPRLVTVDGRMSDLERSDRPAADLMRMVSDNWSTHFTWRGEGPMPAAERQKLAELVRQAHSEGRLVRFWATPERTEVWDELLAANVDLLNTDRLAELSDYLSRARR